ncbi:hypothetical protein BDR22DRAFT_959170 [Usnea florida]
MTRLGDDPISKSRVPTVQILCRDLGFGDTVSQRNFRLYVTDWRKNYRTASGKSGTALLDWESFDDRCNLGVMAQEFLEDGSNAYLFWPSDREISSQANLRYPKDEVTILQLLRRLMWRQNQYMAETNRKSKGRVNDDRSGSEEEYLPPSPSQISQQSKRQLRSKQQKRSHPLLLDSTNAGSGSNKRKRIASPTELHGTSLQLPTNTPSNFRPGDTNSALTTATSRNSGDSEENIREQISQQKRSHTRLLGSNDVGNESNQQDHISMPSELHGTSCPIPASDLDPSNDLDDQKNRPRKMVQLDSLDNPQSQMSPSRNESSPSKTAKAGFSTSTTRSEVDIFIVESSGPRFSMKEWPGGSLGGRTLEAIFNEVTTVFPGQALQRIKFQLETMKMENAMECLIERDDDKIFGAMMQKFKKRIKERKEAGETKFKLYLEVDRGLQEATHSKLNEWAVRAIVAGKSPSQNIPEFASTCPVEATTKTQAVLIAKSYGKVAKATTRYRPSNLEVQQSTPDCMSNGFPAHAEEESSEWWVGFKSVLLICALLHSESHHKSETSKATVHRTASGSIKFVYEKSWILRIRHLQASPPPPLQPNTPLTAGATIDGGPE